MVRPTSVSKLNSLNLQLPGTVPELILNLNFHSLPGACVEAGVCTEEERLGAGPAGPGSHPCGCFVESPAPLSFRGLRSSTWH